MKTQIMGGEAAKANELNGLNNTKGMKAMMSISGTIMGAGVKRAVAMGIMVMGLLGILCVAPTAWADGTINVASPQGPAQGESGWTYNATNGEIRFTESGSYTMTGRVPAAGLNVHVVVARTVVAEITLNNMTLRTLSGTNCSPFALEFDDQYMNPNNCARVTLFVVGADTIISASEHYAGIQVVNVSTLTIENGGGGTSLYVKGHNSSSSERGGAGIGSYGNLAFVGTIRINSGSNILVEAIGGDYAAGIGGSSYGSGFGTIIIENGSRVKATGGKYGAGIGGGNHNYLYPDYGNITITDGSQVEAQGGQYGAGIGGGYNNLCHGYITISGSGGTVKATGSSYGTGIGWGARLTNSGAPFNNPVQKKITISGSSVTANGGTYAAGIGGSNETNASPIAIYGGTVTATGGAYAAGIGGGTGSVDKEGGTVTDVEITGGNITAQGGTGAAGIGSGSYGRDIYEGLGIRIYGGTVTATGGSYDGYFAGAGIGSGGRSTAWGQGIYIYGGTVKARGGAMGAAGIGGGYGNAGGRIEIRGGTVTAIGGSGIGNDYYGGPGIGGGNAASGSFTQGQIYILGGTVTAQGGWGGAGIGPGAKSGRYYNGSAGTGLIQIEGGDITTRGGNYGAGIGGGPDAGPNAIRIMGGNVTSKGGWFAASIGGGYNASPREINITGGVTVATTHYYESTYLGFNNIYYQFDYRPVAIGSGDAWGEEGDVTEHISHVSISGDSTTVYAVSNGFGWGISTNKMNRDTSSVDISGGFVFTDGLGREGKNYFHFDIAPAGVNYSPSYDSTSLSVNLSGNANITVRRLVLNDDYDDNISVPSVVHWNPSDPAERLTALDWNNSNPTEGNFVFDNDTDITLAADLTIPAGKVLVIPKGIIFNLNGHNIHNNGTLINRGAIFTNGGTVVNGYTDGIIKDTWISNIPTETYDVKEFKPEVTVRDPNTANPLTLGRDYTIEYTNNIDAGTATVTVTGTNTLYTGTAIKNFTILPKPLTDGMINAIGDKTYTGSPITFNLTVKDGTRTLTPATTVTALSNVTANNIVVNASSDAGRAFSDIRNASADIRNASADIRRASADIRNASSDIRNASADIRNAFSDIRNASADIGRSSSDIVNPSDGVVNPSDGVVNPSDGIVNPSDGAVNPSDGVVNPSDGAVNPSDGIVTANNINVENPPIFVHQLTANNAQTPVLDYNIPAYNLGDPAPIEPPLPTPIATPLATPSDDNVTILSADAPITPQGSANLSAEPVAANLSDVAPEAIPATATADYDITGWTNNTNAGQATVTITGQGNYTGTATRTFNIVAKNINSNDITIASPTSVTYTGNAITPTFPITDNTRNDSLLREGSDYTLSYANNTHVGQATVTITGKGNYTGTATKTFAITKDPSSNLELTIAPTSTSYTGSALNPTVIVSFKGVMLNPNTDYTLAYTFNNQSIDADKLINAGTYTIAATGRGNYSSLDKQEGYFSIVSKSIQAVTVNGLESSYLYTGTAIEPKLTLIDNNRILTQGTDYTLAYTNNTYIGTATITITGQGNYTLSFTRTFNIENKILTAGMLTAIPDANYTGDSIKPAVTLKDGNYTLVSGSDYTVSYSNNVSAGQATVTLTGKGNYTGDCTGTFTILPKSLADDMIAPIGNQAYTGDPITPTLIVTDGAYTLKPNIDYTIAAWNHNIDIGTATVTLTGKGNYTGTATATFGISGSSIDNSSIQSIPNQPYTGNPIEPAVTVKVGTITLTPNVDYIVTYSNHTNVGQATVTVTGRGDYSGSGTATFNITPKTLPTTAIQFITPTTYTYTGDSIKPTVTLMDGSRTLVLGTDYTLVYSSNVNVGSSTTPPTPTIIAQGTGNYTGNATATFDITPKQIDDSWLPFIPDQAYTGSQVKPNVEVRDGDKTLSLNMDYTITYYYNISPGTASVVVTGIGNYTGKATATFIITEDIPGDTTPGGGTTPGVTRYPITVYLAVREAVKPHVTVVVQDSADLGAVVPLTIYLDGGVVTTPPVILINDVKVELQLSDSVSHIYAAVFTVTAATNVIVSGLEPTGAEAITSAELRVSPADNGEWEISGLIAGEPFAIYNAQGQAVYRGVAPAGGVYYLSLPGRRSASAVYILIAGDRQVKIVL